MCGAGHEPRRSMRRIFKLPGGRWVTQEMEKKDSVKKTTTTTTKLVLQDWGECEAEAKIRDNT